MLPVILFKSYHPGRHTDKKTIKPIALLGQRSRLVVVVYKTPLRSEDRITLHKLDTPNMVNKRVHSTQKYKETV